LSGRPNLILGIESSCDETAAAVVADGREILSSIVASQYDVHRKYGGVVPELASREHLRQIVPVVREALEQSRVALSDVDAIAVTRGPGLVGALLVGVTYGKALAMSLGKPLIGVNHLEGHVHAVLLEAHAAGRLPDRFGRPHRSVRRQSDFRQRGNKSDALFLRTHRPNA
jgi:N6-L-threonylcarbamoyladenine synthase